MTIIDIQSPQVSRKNYGVLGEANDLGFGES
jgi:hypothetical protein